MNKYINLLIIGIICVSCSQPKQIFLETKDAYFGLIPPGTIPEVFAPGIVSDSTWAEHCQVAISPNGDEIYWSAWSSKYPPADTTYGHNTEQIFFSQFKNGAWTKPSLAEFTKDHLTNVNGGPVFSQDGNRLYFYSVDRPGGFGGMDTWYVEKTDEEWSKPINVGDPYNSEKHDWSPVFTKKGNAYKNFLSTVKYEFNENTFLNPDSIIFHQGYRPIFPIYISPEESYLIFDSRIEEGFGDLDLYISFKTKDDKWGDPINMGNKINTEARERFPVVSPDGKYFFFMRHTETQDFFWVSTEIFEELKTQTLNN
jgi:WD40-like Beta Propeller Repeat